MDGKTVLTIAVPAVLLALIYGVPYLLSRFSKAASGWPASSPPPKGTVSYIDEVALRMEGVSADRVLAFLRNGSTPDDASKAAASIFREAAK